MQRLNWNDLRYVLALARGRTVAVAAKRLGVDATTVTRRLRAAEVALGAQLFQRLPEGGLRLTEVGERAIRQAESAEMAVSELVSTVKDADAAPTGTVRVSAVPTLVGRVLVPAAAALTQRHPMLQLELVGDPRSVSLTRREADLALRFARPEPEAGRVLLTRRLGHLTYAAYAPATCSPGAAAALPWVCYEDSMATLPQARWLAAASRLDGGAYVAVNDAEAIIQAIRAGIGRSILPCVIGDDESGIRRTTAPTTLPPLPVRDLWLLTHPDLQPLARIVAVTQWLASTIVALDRRT